MSQNSGTLSTGQGAGGNVDLSGPQARPTAHTERLLWLLVYLDLKSQEKCSNRQALSLLSYLTFSESKYVIFLSSIYDIAQGSLPWVRY